MNGEGLEPRLIKSSRMQLVSAPDPLSLSSNAPAQRGVGRGGKGSGDSDSMSRTSTFSADSIGPAHHARIAVAYDSQSTELASGWNRARRFLVVFGGGL